MSFGSSPICWLCISRNARRSGAILSLCGLLFSLLGFGNATGAESETPEIDISRPPHNYHQRTPADRFTRIKTRLESGELALDRSDEKAFLLSLLRELEVPVSSQALVFSTTSLQLSLISPSNPRAIYFNEEVYVGFIPGGKIEVIATDPELGAIFYIFARPPEGQPIHVERSLRCMNCHAGEETGHVPGLVLKSVIPGPSGGSLTAYRLTDTGHNVPLSERFGGWYLTGQGTVTQHWGNLVGRYVDGNLQTSPVYPGTSFNWAKYPVATSDLLPQLIMEHQAGFLNRAALAVYRTRQLLAKQDPVPDSERDRLLRLWTRDLVRYLLFADEAQLPSGRIPQSPEFQKAFLNRRLRVNGKSLGDFDLRTRLFQHRCSYMINSSAFRGMPEVLRRAVASQIASALAPEGADKEYQYLSPVEKADLREILSATVAELVDAWEKR